jgi:hypothetical protein
MKEKTEKKKPEIVDNDLFENIGKTLDDNFENQKAKYNIWQVLEALRRRDLNYLEKLTEEEKKEVIRNLFVIMKWFSNPQSLKFENYLIHIELVNEIVNLSFYDILMNGDEDYGELVWKLLAIISDGSKQIHKWIPFPKKFSSKLDKLILEIMPLSSLKERKLWAFINGKNGIQQLLLQKGSNNKEQFENCLDEYDEYVSM